MFYLIVRAIFRFCFRVVFKIEITGLENVPPRGRLILCSNHRTNWDPFFHMAFFPRQPFFMGKASAFQNCFSNFFLRRMGAFPVDRGHHDEKAIAMAIRILEDEKVLGMFPEGRRIPERVRVDAKKGVGMFAARMGAPLLPVAIIGSFRPLSKIECKIGTPLYVPQDHFAVMDKDVHYRISNQVLGAIYELAEKQCFRN